MGATGEREHKEKVRVSARDTPSTHTPPTSASQGLGGWSPHSQAPRPCDLCLFSLWGLGRARQPAQGWTWKDGPGAEAGGAPGGGARALEKKGELPGCVSGPHTRCYTPCGGPACPSVPFDSTGCGLMADGRGVGLPLAPGQLSHLHGEVADGGGPVAARDPLEPEAARRHFGLWHQELSGGRRPLCNRERTEQGHVRGCCSRKAPCEQGQRGPRRGSGLRVHGQLGPTPAGSD